jgi:MFS family permease
MAVLVTARVLQGVAGGGVLAAGLGSIGRTFPAGPARTHATGVWGAAVGAGIAVGPLAGAGLAAPLGWRSGFWLEAAGAAAVEPALRFAEAILIIWGLCADGRTDARGRPSPLVGALVATRYRREIRYRQPPDVVQRLLFPPLAAIARRRGTERTLDRYLDLETHPSAEAVLGRLPERVMR